MLTTNICLFSLFFIATNCSHELQSIDIRIELQWKLDIIRSLGPVLKFSFLQYIRYFVILVTKQTTDFIGTGQNCYMRSLYFAFPSCKYFLNFVIGKYMYLLGVQLPEYLLVGPTNCQKKITTRLSASITFKIMNQSKYALGF